MSSLPPAPSGKPVVGNAVEFARDPFGVVERTVESTDDVCRLRLLGRDLYLVAGPDLVETVLLDRDSFAKLADFEVAFGEALLAAEGEQWQRQRRAMEGIFDPSRIGEYVDTMAAITDDRAEGWETGGSIRVDEEMRSVALANLFEVILGGSFDDEGIDDLAETAYGLNRWFEPSSWALPHWVPTPARRAFRRSSAEFRERAASLLEEADPSGADDTLLARLRSLRDDPDSEFTQSEVLDQVVGMLFAGHETTALAMTYALHQIGAHPGVQERLIEEIDAVVDGRPDFETLRECSYLDRVISETLRCYPPVHGIPRETTERVTLGGYTIPAGEQVLLTVWNIHHDERFYDDPDRFDPGRWAETSPRERGYEFVPFGGGPRVCIGRHFSRLEMQAVLVTILRRYRIDAEGDVEIAPQMTSQPADPVTVAIERRE